LGRHFSGLFSVGWKFANWFSGRSGEDGAQTIVYCAVAPDLENGGYYADCKRAKETDLVKDEKEAKKLWEESEKLTGLNKQLTESEKKM
jgi:hypothetical protein